MKNKIILIFLCQLSAFYVKMEPILKIFQGTLNGTWEQSRHGRTYSAFLGIPYAEPPIGNLRFKSPLPAKNWTGIRQANQFGNRCPQLNGMKIGGDEDCLFLNIYTPLVNFNETLENSEEQLLPVMVYIHGGAFIMGSSNTFRANFLLDKNIVLVTINYRVGIFGFFTTGDKASPGNYGLKDQVLALKWIQDNIKSFGGDPMNVTIFGESAGAASVSYHAISPLSDGLFQKYIIQSGSFLSPWAYQSKEELKSYVRGIAAVLFCPLIFSERFVNCMRRKSVRQLMATSSLFPIISWTPTDEPDIEGAFINDNPANLMNRMKDLPFMSGVTADEGLIVSSFLRIHEYVPSIMRYIFNPVLSFVNRFYLNDNRNSNLSQGVNDFYFNEAAMTGSIEVFLENVTKFSTDAFFFYPQLKMLQTITPLMKNKNYFYNFGYRGTYSYTNLTVGNNDNFGVSHTDELNYLFPIIPEEFNLKTGNYTKNDEFMIDVMVDLWTSFATTGKPTSKQMNPPDLWVPFDTERKTHLLLGDINNNTKLTMAISETFYPKRMDFWKTFAPIWP